jgi:hypothetical protein
VASSDAFDIKYSLPHATSDTFVATDLENTVIPILQEWFDPSSSQTVTTVVCVRAVEGETNSTSTKKNAAGPTTMVRTEYLLGVVAMAAAYVAC